MPPKQKTTNSVSTAKTWTTQFNNGPHNSSTKQTITVKETDKGTMFTTSTHTKKSVFYGK